MMALLLLYLVLRSLFFRPGEEVITVYLLYLS